MIISCILVDDVGILQTLPNMELMEFSWYGCFTKRKEWILQAKQHVLYKIGLSEDQYNQNSYVVTNDTTIGSISNYQDYNHCQTARVFQIKI